MIKNSEVSTSKAIFKCEVCLKEFTSKFSMLRHHKIVHLNILPYNCECGKSFGTLDQREKHFVAKHTNKKPFVCKRGCSKAFATINSRLYHYKMHHEHKRYCCTYSDCTRMFTSMRYLRVHISRDHENASTESHSCRQRKNEQEYEPLREEFPSMRGNIESSEFVVSNMSEEDSEEWMSFLQE